MNFLKPSIGPHATKFWTHPTPGHSEYGRKDEAIVNNNNHKRKERGYLLEETPIGRSPKICEEFLLTKLVLTFRKRLKAPEAQGRYVLFPLWESKRVSHSRYPCNTADFKRLRYFTQWSGNLTKIETTSLVGNQEARDSTPKSLGDSASSNYMQDARINTWVFVVGKGPAVGCCWCSRSIEMRWKVLVGDRKPRWKASCRKGVFGVCPSYQG